MAEEVVERHIGPVEAQVRADVEVLMTAHPMAEGLAEMSYALARVMDKGTGGLAIAAVNRELRANLVEMARLSVEDEDGFEDDLSAPVRDASQP